MKKITKPIFWFLLGIILTVSVSFISTKETKIISSSSSYFGSGPGYKIYTHETFNDRIYVVIGEDGNKNVGITSN